MPGHGGAEPARDSALAWGCGLVAGVLFAALAALLWLPFAEPSECFPELPCPTFVRSPRPAVIAIVAVTGGLYAVAVLAIMRRRLALRGQGRPMRPPLWAVLTAATILGLSLVGALAPLAVGLFTVY